MDVRGKRIMTARLIVFLCCIAGVCLAQEKGIAGKVTVEQIQQERPNRWAILIGVDEYDEASLGNLRFCTKDMKLLRDVLTSQAGGFDASRVLLMTQDAPEKIHRPTQNNIYRIVPRWLRDVKAEDEVLIAFSGHGIEKDGETYLLPSDTISENLALSAVSMTILRKWLEDCKAKSKVVILDCCRSQPGSQHKGPESELPKGFTQSLQTLVTGSGFGLLMACAPGERSYEDTVAGHGVFTYHFAQGIQGKADFDKDGRIDVDEAYRYAFENVSAWARKKALKQNPTKEGKWIGIPTLAYYVGQLRRITLSLKCNEAGAAVWINGRRMGTTAAGDDPVDIKLTGAETYQVSIEKRGLVPARFELTPGEETRITREVMLKTLQVGGRLSVALDMLKRDPETGRKLLRMIVDDKDAEAPSACLTLIRDALAADRLPDAEALLKKLHGGWPGAAELKEAETAIWDAYQKQIGNPPVGGATVVYLRRKIDLLKSFMQKNPASHHKREAEQEIADCRKGVLAAYRAEANGIAALARQSMRRGEFDDAVKHIDSIESSIREMRQDGTVPDDELNAIPETLAAELTAAAQTDLLSKLEKAVGAIREAIERKDWNAAHGVEKTIKVSIASAARFDVRVPAEWDTRMEAVLKDLRAKERADTPSLVIHSDPPAAWVYIDGRGTGQITPATVAVEQGRTYTVRLMTEAVDKTYEPWEQKIEVARGGPHHIDAKLTFRKRQIRSTPREIVDAESTRLLGKLVRTSTDKRFQVYQTGVILDTKTNLEWLVGPDKDTNYSQAEAWVKNCNVAGGKWAMPTRGQLRELYQKGKGYKVTDAGHRTNRDTVFNTTALWVWAEPKDASSAWRLSFDDGSGYCVLRAYEGDARVFAVRHSNTTLPSVQESSGKRTSVTQQETPSVDHDGIRGLLELSMDDLPHGYSFAPVSSADRNQGIERNPTWLRGKSLRRLPLPPGSTRQRPPEGLLGMYMAIASPQGETDPGPNWVIFTVGEFGKTTRIPKDYEIEVLEDMDEKELKGIRMTGIAVESYRVYIVTGRLNHNAMKHIEARIVARLKDRHLQFACVHRPE